MKVQATVSFIETRNEVFGDEVKHLEKALIKLLVSEFPGQYGKVENFILEAGYSKEDIPGLIDRTVGRDEKTDFLYKGKHRQKHDKTLQEKEVMESSPECSRRSFSLFFL